MAKKPSKRYAEVEREVLELAELWASRMDLDHWDIEWTFLDSFDGTPSIDDFHTTAVCETRWNYRQAKIKVYLPSAVRSDRERLEEIVVHELCHVVLACEQTLIDTCLGREIAGANHSSSDGDTLVEMFYERLELATENMARTVMRAFTAGACESSA